MAPFKVQTPSATTNNAALSYYENSDYKIADAVKYLSIIVGGAAVLLIAPGLFGGRLIGLECSGVVQLSFLFVLAL